MGGYTERSRSTGSYPPPPPPPPMTSKVPPTITLPPSSITLPPSMAHRGQTAKFTNNHMTIKEGTLLKWSSYLTTNPWRPRVVRLKPGVMYVTKENSECHMIPLHGNPNVITSDPARQQWIVQLPHNETMYLKIPSGETASSYAEWTHAMTKARDTFEEQRKLLIKEQEQQAIEKAACTATTPSVLGDDFLTRDDDDEGYSTIEDLKTSFIHARDEYRGLVDSLMHHAKIQCDIYNEISPHFAKLSHNPNYRVGKFGTGIVSQFNTCKERHSGLDLALQQIEWKLERVKYQLDKTTSSLRTHIQSSIKWKEAYKELRRRTELEHPSLPKGPVYPKSPKPMPSAIDLEDGDDFNLGGCGYVDDESDLFESFESSCDDTTELFHSTQPRPISPTHYEKEEAPIPEDGAIRRRTRLPEPRTEFKTSLWTTLKECVGRDLSRVALPVTFNEPTSFLQRTAEDFAYKEHLDYACTGKGVLSEAIFNDVPARAKSACHIATFLITPYSSALGRTFKPFNPLLGETYEISHRGFHYIAEQVTHHPPALAYHVHSEEGSDKDQPIWSVDGSLMANQNFNGKSLSVQMKGEYNLVLNRLSAVEGPNASQSWKAIRPMMIIDNLIIGRLKIELYGQAVALASDGYCIVTEYYRPTWFGTFDENFTRTVIYDGKTGIPCLFISGKWSEELYVEKIVAWSDPPLPLITASMTHDRDPRRGHPIIQVPWDNIRTESSSRRLIWKYIHRPMHAPMYYEFGYLTFELNELTEDYHPNKGALIPHTDSRFRPDQKLLELGKPQESNQVKLLLEEKQRAVARSRNGEESYRPIWFEKTNVQCEWSKENRFPFNGHYWKLKKDASMCREYYNKTCPKIFLPEDQLSEHVASVPNWEDHIGGS